MKKSEELPEKKSGDGRATPSNGELGRRAFLKRSGLTAGALSVLGALPLTGVRKANAGPPAPQGAAVTTRQNVCTHCSVGCSVIAKVANDVWIGQEPDYDSPINRGSHCCKGAAVRDDVLSERRLRYPVKLVNGEWTRISWGSWIGPQSITSRVLDTANLEQVEFVKGPLSLMSGLATIGGSVNYVSRQPTTGPIKNELDTSIDTLGTYRTHFWLWRQHGGGWARLPVRCHRRCNWTSAVRRLHSVPYTKTVR